MSQLTAKIQDRNLKRLVTRDSQMSAKNSYFNFYRLVSMGEKKFCKNFILLFNILLFYFIIFFSSKIDLEMAEVLKDRFAQTMTQKYQYYFY